jgi:hypothetical protein
LEIKRFVEIGDRQQGVLLPKFLDDCASEKNQGSTCSSTNWTRRRLGSRGSSRGAQRRADVADRTLAPDFRTIANLRKDNGPAIRATCRRFIDLCQPLDLFTRAVMAIDGIKFKAVNAQELHQGKADEADGPGRD